MMADEVLQVRAVPASVVPEDAGETACLPEVQEPVLGQTQKVCRKCGVTLTNTNWDPWLRRGGSRICHPCDLILKRESNRRRYWKDPDKARRRQRTPAAAEARRRWAKNNPARRREIHNRWRHKIREERTESYLKLLARNRGRWASDPKVRLTNNRLRWRYFIACMRKLGGRCVMCGTTDVRVLTVDHVVNVGRNRTIHGGTSIYVRVARGTLSVEGLQCLCYNCNSGVKQRRWMNQFIDGRGTDVRTYF
jgi:hypothetical protein